MQIVYKGSRPMFMLLRCVYWILDPNNTGLSPRLPIALPQAGIIDELSSMRLPCRGIDLLKDPPRACFRSNEREGLHQLPHPFVLLNGVLDEVGIGASWVDGEDDCGFVVSIVLSAHSSHTETTVGQARTHPIPGSHNATCVSPS